MHLEQPATTAAPGAGTGASAGRGSAGAPGAAAGTEEDGLVVNEGWLIKSPPQKRFPRAKWRRRYFLLRRSGALPAQYVLEYFSDQTRRKLKGKIELDQCEQVDAGLTLDSRKHQYDFMFDIRTPKRTFFLAAESKAMMERWVDCICRVCGLKVYSRDLDGGSAAGPDLIPPPRPADDGSDVEDSDSPPVSPSSPSSVSGPYIPISECISGPPGATPEPSPTAPAPARAAVSARPFSGRRRPLARRGTDVSDLGTYDALRQPPAAPAPTAPSTTAASPPPQVNWDTYPGQAQHTRSNSMPETVKGGVNKAQQLKQGPPRPPKPPHLQDASSHNYQNCDELRSPRLSDTESATPRTPTTVPADDMFDFPRSQLDRASGRRRPLGHTSAAPGQIFNYDFSERPPPGPVVNRTLKPRKTSEPASAGSETGSASTTPASAGGATSCSTPGSAPPAVDRALKPARAAAAAAAQQGKVLTLAPPPVRHGAAVRHQRAAPSPTPMRAADSEKTPASSPQTVTPFQDQVYYYAGVDGATARSPHEVQYLDLDLAEAAAEAGSPRSPAKTPVGRQASTGTVYKTVDFVKTEAFNKTRQSVEQERTSKADTVSLSRSSVDVSRRDT